MSLLEQARAAVKAARDFAPADGQHYKKAELATLERLCRDAYLTCQAAGTTIVEVRLELMREEMAAYRADLAAIAERRAA